VVLIQPTKKVDEMAQIIHLRQKAARSCGGKTVYDARLSSHLRESVSDVKSSGNEVFLWVKELEATPSELDFVANALCGAAQERFREQIQLLRGRLSSALTELDYALHNLPTDIPDLKLCSLNELTMLVARSISKNEESVPSELGVSKNPKIEPAGRHGRNAPTASSI
jgi:hypothetical protein